MILVTGTKRSGTSLWMQILINAGFSYIGKEYNGVWEDSIKAANSQGFFESKLRNGIYYLNNPNPENGIYLHPKPTSKYVVKVFVPGLIKTDFAFVHRVVGTVRRWSEYCSSIGRLLDIEDQYFLKQPDVEGEYSNQIKAILRRPKQHPAMVWWRDNFDLIFDALSRGYPVNIVAYDRLLDAPEEVIPTVLEWCNKKLSDDLFPHRPIGKLDIRKGVETVDPAMRTQISPIIDDHGLPEEITQTFDALYNCFHLEGSKLSKAFCQQLNHVHEMIDPIRKDHVQRILSGKRRALLKLGLSEEEVKKALLFKNKA
jgi:hypothetical protein